jgi:hypothetical protein
VRIYDERGTTIDLATGRTVRHKDGWTPVALDEFIKARLPVPK